MERPTLTKIDDQYHYLAELAEAQCTELMVIFERINDPEDPSDDAPERLIGITRAPPDRRSALVFQSEDTPRQRTLVFVDAIFDLAALLNRERVLP